ncbi:MAG: fatty acid desaturase [Kiritimatiellia bacterium]|jgi:fatty acid desaturase
MVDLNALEADLSDLRKRTLDDIGAEDYDHLRRVERIGRTCTVVGYATAAIVPNPASMAMISVGNVVRWTAVAHSVCHRGYDRIEGVAAHHTSAGFARGKQRLWYWLDWILPDAWHQEHNVLHHYRLGEVHDPDCLEVNMALLRDASMPVALKVLIVGLIVTVWKPVYYAPNTLLALWKKQAKRVGDEVASNMMSKPATWLALNPFGRSLWARSLGPYIAVRFALIPAAFASLGLFSLLAPEQVASLGLSPLQGVLALAAIVVGNVLLNSIGAELLANAHSFAVVVPNHSGDDIPRFDTPVQGKGDFYLRQIVGSVNFTSSGFATDFLQGWLNYQIEHHLFPDLPLSQYRKIGPEVREICRKHGIVYREETLWARVLKTVQVMVGVATPPHQEHSNVPLVQAPAEEAHATFGTSELVLE